MSKMKQQQDEKILRNIHEITQGRTSRKRSSSKIVDPRSGEYAFKSLQRVSGRRQSGSQTPKSRVKRRRFARNLHGYNYNEEDYNDSDRSHKSASKSLYSFSGIVKPHPH